MYLAGGSRLLTGRLLSAGFLPGSSRLASGRALPVRFQQVPRSVLTAVTPRLVSASCFATNERIMQVGTPVGPQRRILNLNT